MFNVRCRIFAFPASRETCGRSDGRGRETRAERLGRRTRAGFTLFEVIVALTLSLLLAAAVWEALRLHWGFASAGRADMERSQLARAILKKIEVDIRSVAYKPPEPETTEEGQAADEGGGTGASGSGSGTSGSSGTGTGSGRGTGTGSATGTASEPVQAAVDATSLNSAFTKSSVGIMGNRNRLLLTISRPSRGVTAIVAPAAQNSSDDTLAPPRSDLRSVMYFLGVPGADGLAGEVGSALAISQSGSAMDTSIQGLVRNEGDAMEMALADMSGDQSAMLYGSHLLASEVNFIEFSYFGLGPSGLAWYDMWDSELYQMLPQAIRISVGFYPDESSSQVLSRTYHMVVHVPMSEPYPPEGSY